MPTIVTAVHYVPDSSFSACWPHSGAILIATPTMGSTAGWPTRDEHRCERASNSGEMTAAWTDA
jgi:hypothetical protein